MEEEEGHHHIVLGAEVGSHHRIGKLRFGRADVDEVLVDTKNSRLVAGGAVAVAAAVKAGDLDMRIV